MENWFSKRSDSASYRSSKVKIKYVLFFRIVHPKENSLFNFEGIKGRGKLKEKLKKKKKKTINTQN